MPAAVRVVEAEPEAAVSRVAVRAGDRPVDFAHLARQTSGNRELEREVLQLFVRQTESALFRIAAGETVAVHAHTLKGSASGIGAWRVMRAATAIEEAARTGRPVRAEVEALAFAVDEANAFIAQVLAGA